MQFIPKSSKHKLDKLHEYGYMLEFNINMVTHCLRERYRLNLKIKAMKQFQECVTLVFNKFRYMTNTMPGLKDGDLCIACAQQ